MSTKKLFNCTSSQLITVSEIIADEFKKNIGDMTAIKATWTIDFAQELIDRIQDIKDNYFKLDSYKDVRDSTDELSLLLNEARQKIKFLKHQINRDFRSEPMKLNQILRHLQLNKTLKDFTRTQDIFIANLYTFRNNLSSELIQTITAKEISEKLLNEIAELAEKINKANVLQEKEKEEGKQITAVVKEVLNDLYLKIMDITVVVKAHYPQSHPHCKFFSFNRLIKLQRAYAKRGGTNNENETTNEDDKK